MKRIAIASLVLAATLAAAPSDEMELSGYVESETRYFPSSPRHGGQDDGSLGISFAVHPEIYLESEESGWRFAATPFFRWDEVDPRRTHFDIRELYVQNRFEDLEGVYLVGGGTHPGSGLPVIYESAKISSRLLTEDLGVNPGWRDSAAA